MRTSRSPAAPRVSREDQAPIWHKIAYGLGGMTEQLSNSVTKNMFTPVYNIGLGISPALIGTVLMVYQLWDALADPIMGNISDNTRSRWGRRRPFIVVGGILTGLVMPLLWQPSPEWSQTATIAYMIGVGLLFYTCFTMWAMPYYSLGMEMTPNYYERTRIVAWRTIFSKFVGLLGGWMLALTALPAFADPVTGEPDIAKGMSVMGWVMGLIILSVAILPGLFVKERYYKADAKDQPKIALGKSIRETLSCRPFQLVLGIVLFNTVGATLVSSLGLYLNIYYINQGDIGSASIIQGWKSTATFIPGLLSVPFWTWVSERIGKTKALALTLSMGFVANILIYFCYTPEHPYLQILPHVFLSAFGVAMWMLIPSMQADIVDFDELHTHERREGSFSAIFSWIFKLSATITTGLAGFILVWTGFDVVKYGKTQPPETLERMLEWYVFLPMGFWVCALLLLRLYPLSPARMEEIRSQLEAQRGKV